MAAVAFAKGGPPYTLFTTAFAGGEYIACPSTAETEGCGTILKLVQSGATWVPSVLWKFTGADGANPMAPVLVSGNLLYGTTQSGGTGSHGTAFKIAP